MNKFLILIHTLLVLANEEVVQMKISLSENTVTDVVYDPNKYLYPKNEFKYRYFLLLEKFERNKTIEEYSQYEAIADYYFDAFKIFRYNQNFYLEPDNIELDLNFPNFTKVLDKVKLVYMYLVYVQTYKKCFDLTSISTSFTELNQAINTLINDLKNFLNLIKFYDLESFLATIKKNEGKSKEMIKYTSLCALKCATIIIYCERIDDLFNAIKFRRNINVDVMAAKNIFYSSIRKTIDSKKFFSPESMKKYLDICFNLYQEVINIYNVQITKHLITNNFACDFLIHVFKKYFNSYNQNLLDTKKYENYNLTYFLGFLIKIGNSTQAKCLQYHSVSTILSSLKLSIKDEKINEKILENLSCKAGINVKHLLNNIINSIYYNTFTKMYFKINEW